MAIHDYVIDNQSAPAFRSDLNAALQAIVTQNSSATAPTTTYANMIWYDTAANQLKKRNEANSAWIVLGTIDEALGTFTPSGERALASQAQAEAGTDNTTLMTPLRAAQAIAALAPPETFERWGFQVITTSSTFTIPSGANYFILACGGGGGGGVRNTGSVNTDTKALGGNGGSAVWQDGFASSTLTLTCTIGAGGAAGSVNAAGSAGGATTVTGSGTNITAAGGAGGPIAGTEAVASGTNGASSGGEVYLPGTWNIGTHTAGNISFSGTTPFGGGGTTPGQTTTGMSETNDRFDSNAVEGTMAAFNVYTIDYTKWLSPILLSTIVSPTDLTTIIGGFAGDASADTDAGTGVLGGGGGGGSDSSGMVAKAGGAGWVLIGVLR